MISGPLNHFLSTSIFYVHEMQYFAGRLYQKRKRLVKDNTMSKISSWSYLCKKKLQGEKRWPSSKQPIVRDLLY